MTQAEFNAWIRARFNLWTKSDVDAAIKAEREACAKLCEEEQEYWGWDKVVDAASLIRARGEQA
jgi:hypothetical protein